MTLRRATREIRTRCRVTKGGRGLERGAGVCNTSRMDCGDIGAYSSDSRVSYFFFFKHFRSNGSAHVASSGFDSMRMTIKL